MGIGSLADVSLTDAREAAANWRKMVASGRDPIKERDRLRREAAMSRPTLWAVAQEAFEARKAQLKGDGKAGRWFSPLELHVLPKLGNIPIEDIDQNDMRSALAPIWHEKGGDRAKGITRLKVVLKHAVAMGLDVDLQVTDKARVLLGKSRQETQHIPALPWKDVPEFYATLTDGSICHLALRLLILTAARSAEVRFARFDEIDGEHLDHSGRAHERQASEHRIPLSREALAVDRAGQAARPRRLPVSERPQGRDQRRDDVADDGEAAFRRAVRDAIRKSPLSKSEQAVTLALANLWFHHKPKGEMHPGRGEDRAAGARLDQDRHPDDGQAQGGRVPDRRLPREGRQGVDPVPAASAPADGVLRRQAARAGSRANSPRCRPGMSRFPSAEMSRFAGDKMSHGISDRSEALFPNVEDAGCSVAPSCRRARCLMAFSPARNGKSSGRIRSRRSSSSSPLLAKAIVGSCCRVRSGSARPWSPPGSSRVPWPRATR